MALQSFTPEEYVSAVLPTQTLGSPEVFLARGIFCDQKVDLQLYIAKEERCVSSPW